MSRARGTTLGRRQGGQGQKLLPCRVPLQRPRRPLRRRDRAGQRLLPTIGSHTAEPKFASLVPFQLLFQQAWIAPALAVPPRSPQRCLQSGSLNIVHQPAPTNPFNISLSLLHSTLLFSLTTSQSAIIWTGRGMEFKLIEPEEVRSNRNQIWSTSNTVQRKEGRKAFPG